MSCPCLQARDAASAEWKRRRIFQLSPFLPPPEAVKPPPPFPLKMLPAKGGSQPLSPSSLFLTFPLLFPLIRKEGGGFSSSSEEERGMKAFLSPLPPPPCSVRKLRGKGRKGGNPKMNRPVVPTYYVQLSGWIRLPNHQRWYVQNGGSVGIPTHRINLCARLVPTCMLIRCLLTKFLHRSSVGCFLRVRCWLGNNTCTHMARASNWPEIATIWYLKRSPTCVGGDPKKEWILTNGSRDAICTCRCGSQCGS